MTLREFAEHLGVGDRQVSRWEELGSNIRPRQVNQAALDESLRRAEAEERARFAAAAPQSSLRVNEPGRNETGSPVRPDDPAEDGQWSGAAGTGLSFSTSAGATLATVAELGRADVRRRSFLFQATYVATAMAAASREWLLSTLDAQESGGSLRVGAADIDKIRSTFATFQAQDVIGGGGDEVRHLVASYLTDYVVPRAQAPQSPDIQLALFEVAAEQSYLAGWMAFDSGRHGLAQRYLVQALSLSAKAQNPVLGAHVLAGMSDQATQLGLAAEGLSLAKSGRHGLRGLNAPAALTDLLVLEARAHAVLGNVRDAVHAIDAAERAYDHIRPDDEPEWARFIDEAYVTGEIANTMRDIRDSRNAERFATQSVAACMRQNRNRRASLSFAVLAASHQQRNELEAAASAANQSLTLASGVPSIRCTNALNDLGETLQPFSSNADVGGFIAQLETARPA